MSTSEYTLFRYAMNDVLGLVTQGNAKYNYLVDGTVLAQGTPVLRDFKNQEYELYVQDTWKVEPLIYDHRRAALVAHAAFL